MINLMSNLAIIETCALKLNRLLSADLSFNFITIKIITNSKSNMVPLPDMTNGQQQSSKRSSNTANKKSKKQKSTHREVSPQQTTQIGPTEFELLLKRIADMEEFQKQKDEQQQQTSKQQQKQ